MTPGATQRLPPVLKFPGGPLSRADQRARRHVSKVAVVDVFCAFRMLLCVGKVCFPELVSRHLTVPDAFCRCCGDRGRILPRLFFPRCLPS